MTYLTDRADDRSRQNSEFDLSELDRTDRILLGSCAGIWLAALGVAVAAVVALIDLAGGHKESGGESGTPWILYTIIAISAAVIVAAVPLLLRARRATAQDTTAAPQRPAAAEAVDPQPSPVPLPTAEAPTEKLRIIPPATVAAEPSGPPGADPRPAEPGAPKVPAIDRIWLRCATGIAGAMGIGTFLTAVSTYLMAVGSDTVAWVLYVIAGMVTVSMAAIPWYAVRDLRALIDGD
ncbi:MAG: DUF2561 family protein [Mycolicibacterium sp.]|uniref:DUF2561 family protein n=1 Tax=Mycolicibacterium sp. TaxID=2320850 RepID=UPI003D1099B1